jgi:hypothetical protein
VVFKTIKGRSTIKPWVIVAKKVLHDAMAVVVVELKTSKTNYEEFTIVRKAVKEIQLRNMGH